MVDPSCITPVDVAELKTVIRGPASRYNSPLPFGVTNSPLPSVARSNSLRISATSSPVVNVSSTRQSFRPSLPPVSQRGYPFNDPNYAPLPLRNQRPPTATTTTFGVESPRPTHQITTIVAPPSKTMTPRMQPKVKTTPQITPQQSKSTEGVSDEEFRDALRQVVENSDPCLDLTDHKQIGEGSTGVVDAAFKISTKRIVAVKRMNLRKQQRRELLFNEVSILKKYQHPNIVRFFSSHLVGEELWVVMEYMEGGSLTDIVTATRMTEPQIATISRQVLSALDFLHARQVIHR
uniref:non-specific serine/threonine protein kinase n=1 Tax=Caenorhabditis tropicalis TaxID=1561998 RepID=A0A1I7T351_9PELO